MQGGKRSFSLSSESRSEDAKIDMSLISNNAFDVSINLSVQDKSLSKDTIDTAESENNLDRTLQKTESQDELKEDPLILSLLIEPDERDSSDIENIITYLNCIDACSQFSCNMLKAMAEVAILASTDAQNTTILNDGEELDSWNVIIQGSVLIKHVETGEIVDALTDGQCFGVKASREKQTHKNNLISATDNCQFLCVSKDDFCRIAEDSKLKMQEHIEDSKVVMVTEHRSLNNGENQGHVIIKATPKKLLENLVDSSFMVDPTYVEDFLICHRVFFQDFSETTTQLLEWLETSGTADKAVKIIILWINYCYEDFQDEPELDTFLQNFIAILKRKNMRGPLRFIHIACAGRTSAKTVKYENSSFGQVPYNDLRLVGGLGTSFGVYIIHVLPGGDGCGAGLCELDELTVINKKPIETLTAADVEAVIASSQTISITYKRCLTSKHIMKEQIDNLAKSSDILHVISSPGTPTKKDTNPSKIVRSVNQLDELCHANTSPGNCSDASSNAETNSTDGAISGRKKLKKFFRLKMFTKNFKINLGENRGKSYGESQKCNSIESSDHIPLDILHHKTHSWSIVNNRKLFDGLLDRSLAVCKIFKLDGTWKSLVVTANTTAAEVLQVFNDYDENHSLNCLIMDPQTLTINDYPIKLNENCLQKYKDFNKRFYIRKHSVPSTFDCVVSDIRKNISCNFVDLDPSIVAKAISINNFDLFTRIKVKEYIYSIFEIKHKEKYPNLNQFVDSCNQEMYWVINEIIDEPTISGRAKIIENFIKIAYICKELKNLNSVFFIISGLMHSAVKALSTSWEKVLPKYIKLYDKLQQMLDPSRNMMKYRAMLNDKSRPTLIPIFPVLQKDLTFINDGNSTWNDDLINFEKLRMISKEIRSITQYYSGTFDYMQLFTTKEINVFKVSSYLQTPFRPQYLMHEEKSDHVPLSDLGMTNFATKSTNLSLEQSRILINLASNCKKITKESFMESRVFKYIKTRLDSLECAKEVLVSRAKAIELTATTVANYKKSTISAFATSNLILSNKDIRKPRCQTDADLSLNLLSTNEPTLQASDGDVKATTLPPVNCPLNDTLNDDGNI